MLFFSRCLRSFSFFLQLISSWFHSALSLTYLVAKGSAFVRISHHFVSLRIASSCLHVRWFIQAAHYGQSHILTPRRSTRLGHGPCWAGHVVAQVLGWKQRGTAVHSVARRIPMKSHLTRSNLQNFADLM